MHIKQIICILVVLFPLLPQTQPEAAELKPPQTTLNDTLAKLPADSLLSITDTASTDSSRKTKKRESGKKSELADTVSYEADRIDYNAEEKHLILIGNARIEYQDITLFADTVQYLIDKNLFTASGTPQLLEGSDTTVGDFMVYNIKTRRGRVNHASTHLTDAYFNGSRIVKSDKNALYVESGDYTTCAVADTPHFAFYGRQIKIVPNDKIISRPVVLNIGETPVAVLPYFIFPIERKRRSGFLSPAWGGHPTGGGYLDNVGYYFAPNDYVDVTASTRVYEFKEFIANLSSSYNLKYRLNGSFSGRYKLDSDFRQQQREWSINYSHNQNITPDGKTKLSGRGEVLSSNSFFKKFSEDSSELRRQDLSANLSFSRELTSINGNLTLNYERRHNLKTDLITEVLPSVNFSLPNRPLIPLDEENENDSLKWFNKIYWDYGAQGNVKHTRPGTPNDTIRETFFPGMRQSVNLSSPQTLFKAITVSPRFSATNTTVLGYIDTTVKSIDTTYDTVTYTASQKRGDWRYTDYTIIDADTIAAIDLDESDSIIFTKYKMRTTAMRDSFPDQLDNVTNWNTGVSVSTKLYGLFPVRLFNFTALRHTITPSMSYTYTPELEQPHAFFPSGVEPGGGSKKSQSVSLSLDNHFDGKTVTPGSGADTAKPVEKKFSILSCGLSTAYNFEAEERKWSDLGLRANTAVKNLLINASATYWLYDESNRLTAPTMSRMNVELNIGTLSAKGKFWGGDLLVLDSLEPEDPIKYANKDKCNWNVTLSPRYSFSLSRKSRDEMFIPDKQYSLSSSANLNITRDWDLSWSSTYNFQEDQWVQNRITLSCDLECWDMRFEWRPERLNPGYYFKINIKKIPEIKWEQRRS